MHALTGLLNVACFLVAVYRWQMLNDAKQHFPFLKHFGVSFHVKQSKTEDYKPRDYCRTYLEGLYGENVKAPERSHLDDFEIKLMMSGKWHPMF